MQKRLYYFLSAGTIEKAEVRNASPILLGSLYRKIFYININNIREFKPFTHIKNFYSDQLAFFIKIYNNPILYLFTLRNILFLKIDINSIGLFAVFNLHQIPPLSTTLTTNISPENSL